ncbi:MAG: endonuclease/exonuclease/phosphatase family protein [Verrucomicrobiota bacterium]|nr:endonuclease/exonuclease/phosphatase family protein [Verrucomicrobiota bacterium]
MIWRILFAFVVCFSVAKAAPPETFSIATYNLENYRLDSRPQLQAKTPESRARVREHLLTISPDVLALQEVGNLEALQELRETLKTNGLEFPYWGLVHAADRERHVALLSKFPIVQFRPHTNLNFLLNGRRFQMNRGIAEAEIEVNHGYRFRLLNVHLKSRLDSALADESELRFEEAVLLRERVNELLKENPRVNLVVLGDLNDDWNSRPLRQVIGRGKSKLIDTRPSEQNGDGLTSRNVAWTHFYAKQDIYSRLDYILLSSGMAKEWQSPGSYVFTAANWGLASDHRPVVAIFLAKEQP